LLLQRLRVSLDQPASHAMDRLRAKLSGKLFLSWNGRGFGPGDEIVPSTLVFAQRHNQRGGGRLPRVGSRYGKVELHKIGDMDERAHRSVPQQKRVIRAAAPCRSMLASGSRSRAQGRRATFRLSKITKEARSAKLCAFSRIPLRTPGEIGARIDDRQHSAGRGLRYKASRVRGQQPRGLHRRHPLAGRRKFGQRDIFREKRPRTSRRAESIIRGGIRVATQRPNATKGAHRSVLRRARSRVYSVSADRGIGEDGRRRSVPRGRVI